MSVNISGNKILRSAEDFELQLDRQLNFLRRSCATFDAGASDEAVRIALTIRVLVHNTKQSTSLLTHLDLQNTLSYIDTGIYRFLLDPAIRQWVSQFSPSCPSIGPSPVDVGLIELGDAGGGRVGWYAPLRLRRFTTGTPPDKATRWVAPFDAWWNDPLTESSSGKTFSRSSLVLIVANQDGGGHVDAKIDATYADLIIDPLMCAGYDTATSEKYPLVIFRESFTMSRSPP